MKTALPHEVSEFENLLRKPNSDPTGFAGFFNSGEVWVARVPASPTTPARTSAKPCSATAC